MLTMFITPGAGGEESLDFALILTKMYAEFLRKNKVDCTVAMSPKSKNQTQPHVIISYDNVNWDSFWESEVGIHRLVRVSPFDKQKRRHTSFCTVAMVTDNHYSDLYMPEDGVLVRSYILDPYQSVRDNVVKEGEASYELTDKVKEVLAGNLKLLGVAIKKEK